MTKLDYSIESPEERAKLVEQILEENPALSDKYLEVLADYLVLCMEKQERKEKKILTENRMATVNKREISFEGLVSQLENGEDGIYNLVNEDKQTIFQPKVSITKKDLEEIPDLQQMREAIEIWEEKSKTATGKDAFVIKKALIDLRKDQYLIKDAYRVPVQTLSFGSNRAPVVFNDTTNSFDEDGYPIPTGISLMNPNICSAILCNYSALRQEGYGCFENDTWYLMESFDKITTIALAPYPLYERLVEYKIDGLQNIEIQKLLEEEFKIKHSIEYISSLWRKKIPKLIASAAEDEFLDHYYQENEKGKFKKCGRCGEIKLAHNKYFSKNKTSKDGYYSICKECRNSSREKK